MNTKFLKSVSSLFILLVWTTFASAQNVLLFTFDDSGPNLTATVSGSFDTSGLIFSNQHPPNPPGMFPFHSSTGFFWGTTTATNVDVFEGATAPGLDYGFAYLFNFFPGDVETPLSEYLEINASNHEGFSHIALAEGKTSFNADTLANNVIVFQEGSIDELGDSRFDSSFLSTTPTIVLTDPSGANTIQFVVADPVILLGDVNQDGIVAFTDISPFIAALNPSSPFVPEADCNQDDEVNFLDIAFLISILSQ